MTANELKMLRLVAGWSQDEAAKQLGCSKRSIINWEHGLNQIPDSIALAATAARLKLPKYGSNMVWVVNPNLVADLQSLIKKNKK